MTHLRNWILAAAGALSLTVGALAVAQTLTTEKPKIDFSDQQIDQALLDLLDEMKAGGGKQALADWLKKSDQLKKKSFFSGDTTIPYDFEPKSKRPKKLFSVDQEIINDDPPVMGCRRPRICRKTTLKCPKSTTDCSIHISDCDYTTCTN